MNRALQLYTRLRVDVDPCVGAGWYFRALVTAARTDYWVVRQAVINRNVHPRIRHALRGESREPLLALAARYGSRL